MGWKRIQISLGVWLALILPAIAETVNLIIPSTFSPHGQPHTLTATHIYTPQGVWERETQRYLGPLPFSQPVTEVKIAPPWILGLGEQQLLQMDAAGLQQQFSPIHPEHYQKQRLHPLRTSQNWLATLNEVPTLKHISPEGKILASHAFGDYPVDIKFQDNTLELWDNRELKRVLKAEDLSIYSQPIPPDPKTTYLHWKYGTPPSELETEPSPYFNGGALGKPISFPHLTGTYQWGLEQIFRIYDLNTGTLTAEITLPGDRVSAWDIQGSQLWIARQNTLLPNLEMWEWQKQQRLKQWNGTHTPIQKMYTTQDHLFLVTSESLCKHDIHTGSKQNCYSLNGGSSVTWKIQNRDDSIDFDYHTASDKNNYNHTSWGTVRIHKEGLFSFLPAEAPLAHNKRPNSLSDSWYQPQTGRLSYRVGQQYHIWDMHQQTLKMLNPCIEDTSFSACEPQLLDWQHNRMIFNLNSDDYNAPNYFSYIFPEGIAGTSAATPRDESLKLIVLDIQKSQKLLYQQPKPWEFQCATENAVWLIKNTHQLPQAQKLQLESKELTTHSLPTSLLYPTVCVDTPLIKSDQPSQQQPGKQQLPWQGLTSLPPLNLRHRILGYSPTQGWAFAHSDYPEYLLRQHQTSFWQVSNVPFQTQKCQFTDTIAYCHGQERGYWTLYGIDVSSPSLHWKPLLEWANQSKPLGVPIHIGAQQVHLFKYGGQTPRTLLLYLSSQGPLWVTDQGHHWGPFHISQPPLLRNEKQQINPLPSELWNRTEVMRALQGLPPLHPSSLSINLEEAAKHEHALLSRSFN